MSEAVDQTSMEETVPKKKGCGCFMWVLATIVVVGMITGILAWRFVDETGVWVGRGILWVRETVSQVQNQEINESFRESITQIVSTNGEVLEVAMLETDETVTKMDMKTLFNNTVYLGTTVSEIRTPVVYRYHIQLSDEWVIERHGGRVFVVAPAIRPSQPPAIRTDQMQKRSEAGWLRFNAVESLDALEKNLTPSLEKRAGDERHINMVREACRKSVAEFVKKWAAKSQHWSTDAVTSVTVVFPDEAGAEDATRRSQLPATVEGVQTIP